MNQIAKFLSEYWFLVLVLPVFCYLTGSISFSIIISKKFGERIDVRQVGSGNAGFTNVLRSVGYLPAAMTFVGDFFKGVFVVWVAKNVIGLYPFVSSRQNLVQYIALASGLLCILGHIYPCFYGFRGGKGILTSWATTLLIDIRVFVIIITVFLVVLVFSKIVSLSSICAAMSYPLTTFVVTFIDHLRSGSDMNYVFVCTVISVTTAAIVIWRHRSNISRLIAGSEKKITGRKDHTLRIQGKKV